MDDVGGVTSMDAAQEGADLAELLRRAEPPRRDGVHPFLAHRRHVQLGALHGLLHARAQAVRIEGAGQGVKVVVTPCGATSRATPARKAVSPARARDDR